MIHRLAIEGLEAEMQTNANKNQSATAQLRKARPANPLGSSNKDEPRVGQLKFAMACVTGMLAAGQHPKSLPQVEVYHSWIYHSQYLQTHTYIKVVPSWCFPAQVERIRIVQGKSSLPKPRQWNLVAGKTNQNQNELVVQLGLQE